MLLFMSVLVFHLACVAILIEIRPTILMGVTYRVLISTLSEPSETTRTIARRHALFLEACYVLVPVLFPLLFAWVPFIHDAYGLEGASCWIRELDDNCTQIYPGLVEQYALWHAPVLLVCFIDSIHITAIFVILCKRACATQQTPDPVYKNTLKENIPLLVYPILYQCFALVSVGLQIHKTVTLEVHHVLWMTHAVIPPLRGLLVAVVYIIYLIVWKLSNRSPNITRDNTPLLRSK